MIRRVIVFSFILTALCLSPATAQDLTSGRSGLFDAANPIQLLRQRLTQSSMGSVLLPQEGAVDPEEYVVGPGDYFSVFVGGLTSSTTPIPVTADGHLVLPDVGSIRVAGETLSDARSQVLAALKEHFANVQVDVTLAQPRQFYVHVSGAVPVPGRYLAMPVARAASVLEMVFADTTRAPVSNLEYRPSLRNVTLIRRDGSERTLDLLQYFTTGDTDENPYLRDGDVLHVPAYDPRYASVYVDGEVPYAGAYDHRPGETVLDLLALSGADLGVPGTIRLTRQSADGGVETKVLDVAAMRAGTLAAPVLNARDHLSVTLDSLPGGTATVEGFVLHPGTYPITQGRTTLQALVEQAGGLRVEGAARTAYLERLALPEPAPRARTQNRFEPAAGRPTLMRPDTLEIMQRLRMSDLDFMSRVYFASELRLQNRVSVDLEQVLSADSAPVYLRDGDRLVVPRDEQTVYVFGQVARPGFVAYVPGEDAGYYLGEAGGAGRHAGEAFLVDAATGEYRPAETSTIHSGDMIFLDRTEDVADSPELQRLFLEEQRARDDKRIRTTQIVLQAVGALASSLALIISISRR